MEHNPYVGPRSYERGDRHNFFGRDRDARDLIGLIMAERVVLFYAQSGAGKTSLLNAEVIPALEEEGFHVLPLARVGSDPPPYIPAESVSNIFVFSVLMTLAGDSIPVGALLRHTLLSFLREVCLKPPDDAEQHPPLLILDQFEELFTTHHERWQDAREFLLQLRETLDALPSLGVVFAMREDHVAELDPYASLLPHRLRARFRMERLGPDEALEAVAKPASNAGCPFAPGVAERLVDDLRRIKAQGDGGQASGLAPNVVLGPYIEPVQLQVVCQRLWETLPDQEDHAIQWEEVQQYGDIDRALTDFYETTLAQVMKESGVSERRLRHWFSEQLITPMQTRGLVLRAKDETAGLSNGAVDALESRHLIRADVRAGARWYELVHDRMIDPIVGSNREWEAARQTPLRATAKRWQGAENEVLLYRDKTLKDALAWVEAHPDDVETYEQEFLEASQQAERQRARTRRLYITGAVGLAAALVMMAVLAFWALRQSQIAVARQLAAQAEIILVDNTNLVRGMLLATESMRRFSSLEGNQAVHHGLEQARLPRPLSEVKTGNAVWAVTFSPDGKWISTAGSFASRIWQVSTGRPVVQLNDSDLMGAVALSADGKWLATARGSVVRLWEVSTGHKVAAMTRKFDVNTLAFSPDGKWLATGSWNAAPRIWDVATGREGAQFGQVDIELKPAQVPTTTVAGSRAECDAAATAALLPQDFEHTLARTVTFSPDGKWLATIGNDNTARVWEVATGKEVTHMTHERAVLAVVFSPDGRRLATASRDNTARVWDIASGEQVVKVEHTCDVYDVTFSPDGKYMATASDDGTAGLWEVATGNIVHRLSHKRAVWVVRFSLDGRYVVTGSWDGTARLWEWVTGREVAQMTHAGAVWSVAFSPDGQLLATAGRDATARVWQVNSREATPRIEHKDNVVAAAFSPDGKWFAAASLDRLVSLWQTTTERGVIQLEHVGGVWDIAFSPNSRWLATGSEEGWVRVWDVVSGTKVAEMEHGGRILTVAFSPDGQWVASGSRLTARVWDVVTGQQVAKMENGDWIRKLKFSPNGKLLVTASVDGTARVWDASTGRELARFEHKGEVMDMDISQDGKWLATASEDHTARLFDLTTLREVIWWGHKAGVHAVAFSPDGRWLVSGCLDGTATVWSTVIRIHRPWATLKHDTGVWTMAFSPDGKWLATGTMDGAAQVWDWFGKQAVARAMHDNLVTTVAFSPDERWLATGSMDDTARIRSWRPEHVITEACARLPRNLTREEWQRYIGGEPYHSTCPNLPTPEK